MLVRTARQCLIGPLVYKSASWGFWFCGSCCWIYSQMGLLTHRHIYIYIYLFIGFLKWGNPKPHIIHILIVFPLQTINFGVAPFWDTTTWSKPTLIPSLSYSTHVAAATIPTSRITLYGEWIWMNYRYIFIYIYILSIYIHKYKTLYMVSLKMAKPERFHGLSSSQWTFQETHLQSPADLHMGGFAA